ncbi:adenosylcobalamin-dependent ribonucleoside-diphosphate reductase [Methanococcoides seepicolus]|uniref:Vitamin B12-dependent ribonucleotide reductase n=1 Tax=Methanococcoides seepicolus TaxID=2828780 RepID=A0A9E4ZFP2_9EURY|nr:adenosylcobalamin-dependent ribonucleoside-diphosphate reductase [Methanococcoides seepicolus]MCM1986279.1 adenosylcobalamin-dependent ribonucleoside-diphosphate reductase [Methanococcoides seepicolus]
MEKIRKRDGRIVAFDSAKITLAIQKAILAVREKNGDLTSKISCQVVEALEDKFKDRIPGVEDVQDIVEEIIIRNGCAKVAKAYILYRQKRTDVREAKKLLGVEKDELKLSIDAIRVLERKSLLKDEKGNIIETPAGMVKRVAKAVASVDKRYGGDVKKTEEEFYRMMAGLEFLPNTPTLMNAGTDLGQLSSCFVLPVEDSLKSIFGALTNMSLIHQSGGGTGFSFSKLRPRGDIVMSTKGVTSGPVSFMRIFDQATEVIKQGGKRRGANMGILRVDHPDIIEFIISKGNEGFLDNFNISVGVTDEFMKAVEEDREYNLINPRTGKSTGKLKARDVFDLIVIMSWRTGDPGMVFLDEINRKHPISHVGIIESTNPCGEIPLLPYESCNLGSINLSKMVRDGEIDWEKLRKTTRLCVHFLDNVIDANRYPLKEIDRITKNNRKIGLCVMGFAEMCTILAIPYDSEEAIKTAEKLMKFIRDESVKKSVELGEKRGSFPNFKSSMWANDYKAMRNATVNTVAPTGTISIIANTSSGIEPIFALSFVRNVMGTQLLEVNPVFEKIAKERGFYSTDLLIEISKTGSIKNIPKIPEDIKRVFVTSLDIAPEWHVRMQAAFQKYVDNAVAKTVNLPANATLEDVRKIYVMAYKLKCKGITVYRYGSKTKQVLVIAGLRKDKEEGIVADSEFSGDCITEECPLGGV